MRIHLNSAGSVFYSDPLIYGDCYTINCCFLVALWRKRSSLCYPNFQTTSTHAASLPPILFVPVVIRETLLVELAFGVAAVKGLTLGPGRIFWSLTPGSSICSPKGSGGNQKKWYVLRLCDAIPSQAMALCCSVTKGSSCCLTLRHHNKKLHGNSKKKS